MARSNSCWTGSEALFSLGSGDICSSRREKTIKVYLRAIKFEIGKINALAQQRDNVGTHAHGCDVRQRRAARRFQPVYRQIGRFEIQTREAPMESSELNASAGSVFDGRNYFLPDQIVKLRAAQIQDKRERSPSRRRTTTPPSADA